MCSKWITFRIKTVHVVIHKCALFLNFEFEKKKGGRVVFFLDRTWDLKKKIFNSIFLNMYFLKKLFIMDVYYITVGTKFGAQAHTVWNPGPKSPIQ